MTGSGRPPLQPEQLDEQDAEEYRVTSAFEIQALLRRMASLSELVLLMSASGVTSLCTISRADSKSRRVWLDADPTNADLQKVVRGGVITAAGYLDSVKVQFDVVDPQWTDGRGAALSCRFPDEVFRFQRRSNFRVRPMQSPVPTVTLAALKETDGEVELDFSVPPTTLGVLDVSMTGIGLFLPEGALKYPSGMVVPNVVIALEPGVRLGAELQVLHLTEVDGAIHGHKVGCEFYGLNRSDLRVLQQFIDRTQSQRSSLGTGR